VAVRSTEEIEARIRFLLMGELDRRVAEAMKRLPQRCKHNHRQPLDSRKQVEGDPNPSFNRITDRSLPVQQTLGLCMYGAENTETWPGNICEDPVDAHRCGDWFEAHQSKEELLDEFYGQVADMDWLKEELPEVYGLAWALGAYTAVKLPWWKELWFWVLTIKVEPVVFLPPPLLPGGEEEADGTVGS